MRTYSVQPLKAPDLLDIASHLGEELTRAHHQLGSMKGLNLGILHTTISDLQQDEVGAVSLKHLEHSLSNFVPDASSASCLHAAERGKSVGELDLQNGFQSILDGSLAAGFSSFVCSLVAMNGEIRGARTRLREGMITTDADTAGAFWIYPDAIFVRPMLRDVFQLMASDDVDDALLRAIIVIGIYNCAHPFGDGNGRMGRILFHHVLSRSRLISRMVYLPCYELCSISRHGYLIRLRDLSISLNWVEFVRFFCRLVDACTRLEELQRSSLRRSDG